MAALICAVAAGFLLHAGPAGAASSRAPSADLDPVFIDEVEAVTVGDGARVLPPAVVTETEAVTVGDSARVLPPAILTEVEAVTVGDSERVLPPVHLDVVDAVSVGDAASTHDPSVTLDVDDSVVVGDTARVLPPVVIAETDPVAVGDGSGVLPSVIIDEVESVLVGDGAAPSVSSPGLLAFSASAYAVPENGGSVTITVTRSGGSDGAVSVVVSSGGGTATSGVDYTPVPATLTWTSGDATPKTATLTVLDDAVYEGDETLSLTLSTPTGGASSGGPATVTIVDDDPQRHSLTITVVGDGTVTVSPGGVPCLTTCQVDVVAGATVTLAAVPGSAWTFTGWSGACSGGSDCSITVSSPQSVTATFTKNPPVPVPGLSFPGLAALAVIFFMAFAVRRLARFA